ncbi:MAG: hypothetical protein ACXWLZ_02020 [Rhizomicrobium sp.]
MTRPPINQRVICGVDAPLMDGRIKDGHDGGHLLTGQRILAALLILGAVVTVAYWLNYFIAGDVRVLPDYWYSAFEDSFPVADGWMALCMFIAGIGLWRGSRNGALFGLMAGSALIYLACMDITFNIEHGLYALVPKSGPMLTEAWINASSLGLGVATLIMSWRRAAAHSSSG